MIDDFDCYYGFYVLIMVMIGGDCAVSARVIGVNTFKLGFRTDRELHSCGEF